MGQRLGSGQGHIDHFIVSDFSVLGVYAAPALLPRLGFRMACRLNEINANEFRLDSYQLIDLNGELHLGGSGAVVGPVHWTKRGHQQLRSLPSSSDQQFDLACDLDPLRLERLEAERNGDLLSLSLQLWPRIFDGDRFYALRVDPIRFSMPRDQWLEFLDRSQATRHEVIEVRWPQQDIFDFKQALAVLRGARSLVRQGDFKGAVQECRHAIEAFFKDLPDKEKGKNHLQAYLQGRFPAHRVELYRKVFAALKDVTNIAHHKTQQDQHSREEAMFLIRSLEIYFSLIGSVLDQGSCRQPPGHLNNAAGS